MMRILSFAVRLVDSMSSMAKKTEGLPNVVTRQNGNSQILTYHVIAASSSFSECGVDGSMSMSKYLAMQSDCSSEKFRGIDEGRCH